MIHENKNEIYNNNNNNYYYYFFHQNLSEKSIELMQALFDLPFTALEQEAKFFISMVLISLLAV